MNEEITVLNIIASARKYDCDLHIKCIAGRRGLDNKVDTALNRPGLALNSKFVHFGENRIQIFGRGEVGYLYQLEQEGQLHTMLEKLFQHNIPCCVVSHTPNNMPPQAFIDVCEQYYCPLLVSTLSTFELSMRLFKVLSNLSAPSEIMHGTFMEVHNVGVMITGKSGVGKSEAALELLERKTHRLIVDDAILLQRVDSTILGQAPDASHQYKRHLEIRGLGFLNVAQLYGISATLDKKELNLVINLQRSVTQSEESNMDRLGDIKTISVMGISLPYIKIVVKPGRNISLLIEVAAIKYRLQRMGYHGKEDPYLW